MLAAGLVGLALHRASRASSAWRDAKPRRCLERACAPRSSSARRRSSCDRSRNSSSITRWARSGRRLRATSAAGLRARALALMQELERGRAAIAPRARARRAGAPRRRRGRLCRSAARRTTPTRSSASTAERSCEARAGDSCARGPARSRRLALADGVARRRRQMPNPKEISGVPLPAPDLPAGTVSVRVVRGDFANNVTESAGRVHRRRQDADEEDRRRRPRAGLGPRARHAREGGRRSSTASGSSRRTSRSASSGIRVVLVATDPEAAKRAAEDRRAGRRAGRARHGRRSRARVARRSPSSTTTSSTIFYVLDILNTARTPVDIGGPLIIELPHGSARRVAAAGIVAAGDRQRSARHRARAVRAGHARPCRSRSSCRSRRSTRAPRADVARAARAGRRCSCRRPAGSTCRRRSSRQSMTAPTRASALLCGAGPALPAGTPFTLDDHRACRITRCGRATSRSRWPA